MPTIRSTPIKTNRQFETQYKHKVQLLLMSRPVNRGTAHAMKDDTTAVTLELMHVLEIFDVDDEPSAWQEVVKPNLPWAEDHFRERIGGEPLNPAPSEAWWPFARRGNAEHKKDQKFSHTYPERFWPKRAGEQQYETLYGDETEVATINVTPVREGIRFEYGDLSDVIAVLKQNPFSRQAYLAVWFPEDATAARLGERVPCSMGYHFIYSEESKGLDCVYTMRSCDIVRFYRDDIYMAGRLLQYVAENVGHSPGQLVVHIDNLHCFPGDRPHLEQLNRGNSGDTRDPRADYDFGALM